jgi:hypothetical protein
MIRACEAVVTFSTEKWLTADRENRGKFTKRNPSVYTQTCKLRSYLSFYCTSTFVTLFALQALFSGHNLRNLP